MGRKLPSVGRLYVDEDQLESLRAFAGKRDPVWKAANARFPN